MESLAEILEGELEQAVEVKDKKSLHRYITLLTENLSARQINDKEHSEFREAIIKIDTRIEEGFKRMDERFVGVNMRLESMEKRFGIMVSILSVGFLFLGTMIVVLRFLF